MKSKIIRNIYFLFLTAISVFSILRAETVEAAAPNVMVTGLKQVDCTTVLGHIQWNNASLTMTDGHGCFYNVYKSKTRNGEYKIESGYGQFNSDDDKTVGMRIRAEKGETSFFIKIAVITFDEDTQRWVEGQMSKPFQVVIAPKEVTNLRQTGATEKSVTIEWDASAGATHYRVSYYDLKQNRQVEEELIAKTFLRINSNQIGEITVIPIQKGENYTAVNEDYSKESICTYNVPVISKVKLTEKFPYGPVVEWSCNSVGKGGYEYIIYNYKGKKKLVTGENAYFTETSQSAHDFIELQEPIGNFKFKNNQFYGIKVRGYIIIEGKKKYGKWSNMFYFGTDYNAKKNGVKIKKRKKKLDISWQKVKGATSYTIYVSDNFPYSLEDMTKIKTIRKRKYTLKKFKKHKIITSEKYYVVIRANKKVGKKTYVTFPKVLWE